MTVSLRSSSAVPAGGSAGAGRVVRLKLAVRGAVQGVGFRPFAFRLAQELGLAGGVNNSPAGVFIEAEGPRAALEDFLLRLEAEKPPGSFIQSLEAAWLDPAGLPPFAILPSAAGGRPTALVMPDLATCPDCLFDLWNPAGRRYLYPFTNCTHCGPRFSIIEWLPYDRAHTSMKQFTMCPQCQAEYDDPRDRRFHAQPNACPACGPHLELWNPAGEALFANHQALLAAVQAIRRGRIVAVKGVGGFHLLVDACNEAAVRRLRARKHREEKPLALMFPTLDQVRSVCEVSPLEARLLRSSAAPLVLLRRLRPAERPAAKCSLADSVAPGNPNLGVLLPSNPLHYLLLINFRFPVVATSGNLSDEPICIDEDEALERLGGIADCFLVHDRPIVRHADDSIVRVMLGRELMLRRARGCAPLPITLNSRLWPPPARPVLAVGAHLKNTIALAVGGEVFLSQHIGDLDAQPARSAFRRVVADFEQIFAARPATVATDLHPDYFSTQFAGEMPDVRRVGVQHHLAHVLSCLAENEIGPPALGVAWDGTGLGLDGTIWGGEFFAVTLDSSERVAHLRPFRLPGGDQAVREPRRAALGLLYEMLGHAAFTRSDLPAVAAFTQKQLAVLQTMLKKNLHAPLTSSAGRLFDAVASLTGLRQKMHFEGQAAMDLEFALADVTTDDAYPLPLLNDAPPLVLDWAPAIAALLADLHGGVCAGLISAKFHNALAAGIVRVARHFGFNRVALSGGCFQNRYLTERTVAGLRAAQFQPYWHQRVPANDGGIALGQIVGALRDPATHQPPTT
jgi:hydrogenase maturation protein HypF